MDITIAKMAKMLMSDNPHEVFNAAQLLEARLKRSGKSLHEFVEAFLLYLAQLDGPNSDAAFAAKWPHQEWARSKKGNDYLRLDHCVITIFECERGYKFCIARIGSEDSYFCPMIFPTKVAAKEAALEPVLRLRNREKVST